MILWYRLWLAVGFHFLSIPASKFGKIFRRVGVAAMDYGSLAALLTHHTLARVSWTLSRRPAPSYPSR
jgi:hypothetical protein